MHAAMQSFNGRCTLCTHYAIFKFQGSGGNVHGALNSFDFLFSTNIILMYIYRTCCYKGHFVTQC